MSNLTTDLKAWGSTGSLWPDTYSQVEGEAPVDDWHNKLFSELIANVKDDLIPTVNGRAESYVGNTRPASPEDGHQFVDLDDSKFDFYDGASWNTLALDSDLNNHTGRTDNPHSVTASQLNALQTSGGTLTGSLTLDDSPALFENASSGGKAASFIDTSGGNASEHTIEVEDIDLTLTGRDTSGTSDTVNDLMSFDPVGVTVNVPTGTLQEKGNRVATRTWANNKLSNKSDTGHLHDTRYLMSSGDTMGGSLDLGQNNLENTAEVDFVNTARTDHNANAGTTIYNGGNVEYYDGSSSSWKIVASKSWASGTFASSGHTHNTLNNSLDIYSSNQHLDLFESDNADKQWRVQVTGGNFRVDEPGTGTALTVAAGGDATFNGNVTVGGGYLEIPVYTSTQTGMPNGAIYVVE